VRVLTEWAATHAREQRAVKQHGGTVIAQGRRHHRTIYGMPAAVAQAGLTDQVLPLHQIASGIVSWCDPGAVGRPRHGALGAVRNRTVILGRPQGNASPSLAPVPIPT